MLTILAPYFTPAFKSGGPIKSIKGVCNAIGDRYSYQILTRNRDLKNEPLDPAGKLENVIYLDSISLPFLYRKFRESDIVWINSPYSIPFSFIPLLVLIFIKNKTVLISPRGQLMKGAINRKKKLYLYLYRFILTISRNKVVFHFTHEVERNKSWPIFKKFKSIVFLNPVNENPLDQNIENVESDGFKIGFFGRVVPKKNIEFVIRLLPQLDKNVTFHIYGFVEDLTYKAKCDRLIEELNIVGRVSFHGGFKPKNFPKKASNVQLIVIPSLSENFCHVFFEAIEMNKLVIASTGLPWKDINNYVADTLIDLVEELWVQRIETIINFSKIEYSNQQLELKKFYTLIQNSIKQDISDNFNMLMKDYATEG